MHISARGRPEVGLPAHFGAIKKGGVVNLRFTVFLDFPYGQIVLLVWDSCLQLICDVDGQLLNT